VTSTADVLAGRADAGRIAGVVFDKDGTLLDYAASWGPINLAAAEIAAAGDPLEAARLLVAAGGEPGTGRALPDTLLAAASTAEIAHAWAAAGSPLGAEALTLRLDALFRSSVDRVVPVTDLAALFLRLRRRGLKLGICSSDNAAAIAATAERFGIAPLVDFIAGYDSGHGVKPGPGMVEAFCRATGIHPAQVAVVGDNGHDVEMGRAAGAGLVVGVLTGTGTRSSLAHADHVVDDILAIEALIEA
jgi:phosphoglycolate phosphatase